MENLIKIQQELKAPKGQYNSFGKYKYRSAEDILEAVKPLLGKYNVQLTLSDEIVEVGGRIYVKATANICEGGEKVTVTAFAREPADKKGTDDSQITGAASSYARKYALNGLFLIDDTKDADTDEYKNQQEQIVPKQQPKSQPRKLSATTVKAIEDLIVQTGSNKAELLNYYHVTAVENMTQDAAKHCIGILRGKLNG
jgi:hypothetical protein